MISKKSVNKRQKLSHIKTQKLYIFTMYKFKQTEHFMKQQLFNHLV